MSCDIGFVSRSNQTSQKTNRILLRTTILYNNLILQAFPFLDAVSFWSQNYVPCTL